MNDTHETNEIENITKYLNGEQYITVSILTGNLVKKMMTAKAINAYCETCSFQDTCNTKCANLKRFEDILKKPL